MKKYYFLIIIAVLSLGCSGDDDSLSYSLSYGSLNPPEWLQGSYEGGGFNNTSFQYLVVKVTKDNVEVYPTNIEGLGDALLDVNNRVYNLKNGENDSVRINEKIKTDSIYEFHLEVGNQNGEIIKGAYRFLNLGDREISYIQNNRGSTLARSRYYEKLLGSLSHPVF